MGDNTDVGELNPISPGPFQQPFLILHTTTHEYWHVDVGGLIDKYFDVPEPGTTTGQLNTDHASPLLKDLCKRLRTQGISVHKVSTYTGSAGPSHILKNGVFFKRMGADVQGSDLSTGWMDT